MDQLTKFLRKQNKKMRVLVLELIDSLIEGNLEGCEVGKLKGFEHRYRLKKGRIRIIFDRLDHSVQIVRVGYRDENTYKNL